jgi:hypothetical protein
MRCVHLKGAGNITTIGIASARTHSTWLGWISGAQSLRNERYPDVRLIPAQHVKPFLKNNCRDAEAVAEAVQRPTMIFVLIKTRSKWICWLCIVCPRASSANGRGVWVGCRRATSVAG